MEALTIFLLGRDGGRRSSLVFSLWTGWFCVDCPQRLVIREISLIV
jgi:hypothetical protein